MNYLKTNKLVVFCILALMSLTPLKAQKQDIKSLSEKHHITVEADNVKGEIYNLWDVRVINAPERWGKKGYAQSVRKSSSERIKYIMNVRSLGGKHNNECEWYKGIDKKGNIICDFEPFIDYMKEQLSVDFTPRIVLDNVPNAMNEAPKYLYGNCSPPDDYDIWFQYIQQFVQTLVNEFGMEEVSKWQFRVGTEPDLYPKHWAGTRDEFFKHYDYTVAAVESVIEDPIIGPGNMLMYNGTQNTKGGRWGFDMLKHCAEGTNYYTGKTGTQIDYFSQSVYAWAPKPFAYEENMQRYKVELAKYPELKDIGYEIHEYGELMEALSRGDALGQTEWFAGLYAHTVDVSYNYGCNKVFNWGGVGGDSPRSRVVDCLVQMENGERVNVIKDKEKILKFGSIAAWKDGDLHLLVYSHRDDPGQDAENEIKLSVVGDRIAQNDKWTINQEYFDRENGVAIYDIYKDIEATGITPLDSTFFLTRTLTQKYGKKNDAAVSEILKVNEQKYNKLKQLKKVRVNEEIIQSNGKIDLVLTLKGSGFHFITLSSQ
jgi:xylan 1,4-beta-xylosidase